jgi:hypothetical protein
VQSVIMLNNSVISSRLKKRKAFLISGTGLGLIMQRLISVALKAVKIATFFDLPGRSPLANLAPELGLVRSNWRFMQYQGQRSLVVVSSNKQYLILNLQTGLIKYVKFS